MTATLPSGSKPHHPNRVEVLDLPRFDRVKPDERNKKRYQGENDLRTAFSREVAVEMVHYDVFRGTAMVLLRNETDLELALGLNGQEAEFLGRTIKLCVRNSEKKGKIADSSAPKKEDGLLIIWPSMARDDGLFEIVAKTVSGKRGELALIINQDFQIDAAYSTGGRPLPLPENPSISAIATDDNGYIRLLIELANADDATATIHLVGSSFKETDILFR